LLPIQKSNVRNQLGTRLSDLGFSSENNTKKKPETALFCNKTKAGVDAVDRLQGDTLQMHEVAGVLTRILQRD